jgi:putative transposase
VIVEFIDAHRDEHGVEPICEQLQVAPSTYYAHRSRPPSARSITDAATTTLITQAHAENFGVYGARKIHAQLHRQGHPVARCTVQRLMRAASLRGLSRAKGPRTTIPGSGPDLRPDLVERSFTATGPDQLWVADITYCRTFAGWVYAAFVFRAGFSGGSELTLRRVSGRGCDGSGCPRTRPVGPARSRRAVVGG